MIKTTNRRRSSTAVAEEEPETTSLPQLDVQENDWLSEEHYDGQLAVDVYQTADAIVIKAAIAGVEPDDLDIAVQRDIVTIRGRRKQREVIAKEDYLFQECYWGSFSRSVILPIEVDASRATANLMSGLLVLTLPKAKTSGPRRLRVQSEE